MKTFNEFGLNDHIVRALNDMGFEESTPIQNQTVPATLEGKDLIGQAQTGTGKTAAFGIPLIDRIIGGARAIQGVVLTPTRELAVQVAEEINRIAQHTEVHALPIYGGQDIQRQIKALKKKPQIIVATPGRFMDHMRRKTIRLNDLKMVVLDEADEMLNMGFIDDIKEILAEMPTERQTLLFSATMPKAIQELATKFMKDPEVVSIKAKEATVSNITQEYVEVSENQKFDVFCRLLDIHSPELAIVFGRTKRRVDELAEGLNKRGYEAEGIHGDLNQAKRDRVLRRFKDKTIEVLVATDVAARGLDISGVTHVYNFDLPQDSESYVHRIGRTGRAGRTGIALTFVTPREMDHLKAIERMTKRKVDRRPVPTMSEAIEGQQRMAVEKLQEAVQQANYSDYKAVAEQLVEDQGDSVSVIAAALKLLTKEPNAVPVKLTEEAPMVKKKNKRNVHSRRNGQRGDYKRHRNDRHKGDRKKGGGSFNREGGYKGKGKSGSPKRKYNK
ncbi:DEAD/DEAH box helicase [Caldalkalibacillus salinus]|uniref:DEAD/DEAH box helicase n=1 Tax=Caldalkalibacillus salinus TaxID=2803787 RepID=UPI001924269A|nr:DEAD/DEAH box helicase [Caldalkalibacillus salinus]